MRLALLLEVDSGAYVGQVDHHLTFAVAPALEVDVAHAVAAGPPAWRPRSGCAPPAAACAVAPVAACRVITTFWPSTAALYFRLRFRFRTTRVRPPLSPMRMLSRHSR